MNNDKGLKTAVMATAIAAAFQASGVSTNTVPHRSTPSSVKNAARGKVRKKELTAHGKQKPFVKDYQDVVLKGSNRNKPCLCGSGLKVKKCHGKNL